MRAYLSTVWFLSVALYSSAAADQPNFTFNGDSFTTHIVLMGGSVSIFKYGDIENGKNFTLKQEGGPATVTGMDLMEGDNLTLASWCSDQSCTPTPGFDVREFNDGQHNITLGSEVTRRLDEYIGAILSFRLDWQPYGGQPKQSVWSQRWSVATTDEDVGIVFADILQSSVTMTAGGPPVSGAGPAPTTVASVAFNVPTAPTTPTTAGPITSNTTAANSGKRSGGLTTGSIVGIVVGVVGGLILVSVVAGCFCFRRRRDAAQERGGSRGVQDIVAEKEAHASILDRDQPDTPYSEQNSQHPLHRGLGLAGRNESGVDLGIGQAISGEGSGSVRTESLHTLAAVGNDRTSVVYSSLGGGAAANSAHGTPVMGSGAAFAGGGSGSPRAQPHTPSMSAHDRSSAMGSPVPRASSQLDRSLSPYRDDAGQGQHDHGGQHHRVVDGADLVQQEHHRDSTGPRSPSSVYSTNPLDEMQPISPESARESGGGPSSQRPGHNRSTTPSGISGQYAHLVEEGMTDDEIRRMEEEERALDEAIEQAGTTGRKR